MKRLRILHPSDFSPASRPAFRKAVELVGATGGQLLVVHVLPPLPMVPDVYVAATTYDALQRSHRALARKQLDRLVAKAKAEGIRASGVLLDFGVAYAQIDRVARSRRVDMIVMGTHGRGRAARVLLGSVAERVVATAPCPVLTVRAK